MSPSGYAKSCVRGRPLPAARRATSTTVTIGDMVKDACVGLFPGLLKEYVNKWVLVSLGPNLNLNSMTSLLKRRLGILAAQEEGL